MRALHGPLPGLSNGAWCGSAADGPGNEGGEDACRGVAPVYVGQAQAFFFALLFLPALLLVLADLVIEHDEFLAQLVAAIQMDHRLGLLVRFLDLHRGGQLGLEHRQALGLELGPTTRRGSEARGWY